VEKSYKTPQEEAKYWHDAYWDLMYKNYCDLPISVKIEDNERKFLSFKGWWNDQLGIRKSVMVKKKDEVSKWMKEATEELDEAEVINHPKLELLQGGKDGKSNWLLALPVGTIFMSKKKGELEFVCHQWIIDWKGKRGVLLTSNLPIKQELPVDSLSFSLTNEMIEIQRLGFENVEE
jgi:hypothetical protein